LRLSRRHFLQFSVLTAGTPALLFASRPQTLPGRLLGLTTLDKQSHEVSSLFSLSLSTGQHKFYALADYRFGHSLEPLANGSWVTIPYGDDSEGCLVIDANGAVQQQVSAPKGMGFSGHGAILKDGRYAVFHFNRSDRIDTGGGEIVIADTSSGKIVKRRPTPLIHGHDMLLSNNGHIIVSDDGAIESDAVSDPLLMTIVKPALYYFSPKLDLIRTVPLPINGSFVHISEDASGKITGAVEQYVRRTKGGTLFLQALLGADTNDFIRRFDPEVFPDDVPLPGPLVGVDATGIAAEEAFSTSHLDPFDMVYNERSGVTCCVFTESNLVAWHSRNTNYWQYVSGTMLGVKTPFGLTNIGDTSLIAVNDFDRGVAVFDSVDMSLTKFFDVPTRGVKHLSFDASSQVD
jgi:hypothetical protein